MLSLMSSTKTYSPSRLLCLGFSYFHRICKLSDTQFDLSNHFFQYCSSKDWQGKRTIKYLHIHLKLQFRVNTSQIDKISYYVTMYSKEENNCTFIISLLEELSSSDISDSSTCVIFVLICCISPYNDQQRLGILLMILNPSSLIAFYLIFHLFVYNNMPLLLNT